MSMDVDSKRTVGYNLTDDDVTNNIMCGSESLFFYLKSQ